MKIFGVYLTVLLAAITGAGAAQFTESDWQVAFNDKVAHGKLEVEIATGRIDILTETYAIEVDHARNYRAAVKQSLQYAAETGKTAGIALVMDGAQDTLQAVQAGKKLAEEAGVAFWLINEYVSVNDLADQKPKSAGAVQQTAPTPQAQETPTQARNVEKQYWINTKDDVRHNRSCRWFGNTVNGHPCESDEGRACKQCGG